MENDTVDETVPQVVTQVGKVAKVSRVDVHGSLDLDTGHPAICGLGDDIDLPLGGIPVVTEPHLLLGLPTRSDARRAPGKRARHLTAHLRSLEVDAPRSAYL